MKNVTLKRPLIYKPGVKMTATSTRPNPIKAKKPMGSPKITIPKTASSGIKHQVILPKTSTVIASSSSIPNAKGSSSPRSMRTNGNSAASAGVAAQPKNSVSTTTMKTVPRPGRVSKRNGVWYLGGNHVVKLLTSVDGDLDHSVLAKLAAVPTVIGELALSVESLVSDDVTVGGFESDLLAKITSNTLTAKRGIMAAQAASVTPSARNLQQVPSGGAKSQSNVQRAPPVPTAVSSGSNTAPVPPAPVGDGQVPNPLLANYQPVPNPLAIRITPPASPHTNVTEQPATNVTKTRDDVPMIQAR